MTCDDDDAKSANAAHPWLELSTTGAVAIDGPSPNEDEDEVEAC